MPTVSIPICSRTSMPFSSFNPQAWRESGIKAATSASAGAYSVPLSGMIAMPSPRIPAEKTPSPTSARGIEVPDKNAVNFPDALPCSSCASFSRSTKAAAPAAALVPGAAAISASSAVPFTGASSRRFFPVAAVNMNGTANAITMQTAKDAMN